MAIYERQKGVWSIIVTLPKGSDGKYKQKTFTLRGNKKEARAREAELMAERGRGEFVEPTRLTLGEWLDTWLEKSVKPPLCTINTYRTYRAAIRQHLKPRLGSILIQRLTAPDLERVYAESKLKPATVRLHHAILTRALNASLDANIVRNNVGQKVRRLPKISRSQRNNVWTAEEARRFIKTLKDHESGQLSALFTLALDTGCRKAELLGLKWSDLTGPMLRVERQLIRMDGGADDPTFGVPKGKEPRVIELQQQTLDLLKMHKAKQAELKLRNRLHYIDHGLMFAQEWEHQNGPTCRLGKALNMMTMNGALKRLCKSANVPLIKVHDLRHTCATLMLEAGVSAKVVQERLGHADIKMTMNTYTHVSQAVQHEAVAKLANLLHG